MTQLVPIRTFPLRYSILTRTLLAIVLTVLLAGCINLNSEPADPQTGSTPTPAASPESADVPSTIESSIVPIRSASEFDELLGSAVVVSSDGLLLTALELAQSDIEVVLPDGSIHRPALVSIEPGAGLALIRVPRDDLTPVEFGAARPSDGADVVATGYDGSPGSLGHMSGSITGSQEPADDAEYRVRGSAAYQTDINYLSGFIGGALMDTNGQFCGIIIAGGDSNGVATLDVASHWFVTGWLERREQQRETLRAATGEWEIIDLPGEWTIRQPDGWTANVQTDSDDAYRSELNPADPDIPLQLAISVEENEYGSDPEAFIERVFADRESARLWSVTEEHGRPLVRATMSQEGALLDVAYLLDGEFLIAISLRTGYQPQEDHVQVDQARSLFEIVIESIDQE